MTRATNFTIACSITALSIGALGGYGLAIRNASLLDGSISQQSHKVNAEIEVKPQIIVQDWLGTSSICELHKVQMDVIIVHGLNGTVSITPAYAKSKDSLFPNHGILYGPELYNSTKGAIYVCKECRETFAKWNPNGN
jgi:hypothetical protein